MFGRCFVAAAIGVVLITPTISVAEHGDGSDARGVNARQHRQAARIRDGVNGGEITRRELNRLTADRAAIRAEERLYRRSGDGLNRWERRDLQRDLGKTSREVYRAKHDRR